MPEVVAWLAAIAESGSVELFPDPEEVFAAWSPALAARVMPVARFDLAQLEDGRRGPATFLYYEDYACSFLSWEVRRGRIVELDTGHAPLRPFADGAPDRAALLRDVGAWAELSRHEVEVPPAGAVSGHEWSSAFESALEEQGARSPLQRLRLGGRHPCWVQSEVFGDEVRIDAELPTGFLELAPVYLYLSADPDGARFTQEMQMT